MAKYDSNWWFGDNSLWSKGKSITQDLKMPKKGGINFMGFGFNWDKDSMNFTDNSGRKEADLMKYGFIALGVYMIWAKWK